MKRIPHLTLAALAICAVAATGSAAAGSAGGPMQADAAAAQDGGADLLGAPRGYILVQSALITAPTGAQTRATVFCPGAKMPLGGGVVITSNQLAATVNSSFPNANTWIGDVNNATGAATTFRVFALCARQPQLYQVVSATAQAPAGAQGSANATCPAGTAVLGGGALARSGDLRVNMNSSFPNLGGWRVDVNNATGGSVSFDSRVVCAKSPRGYRRVSGPTGESFPVSVSSADASCPTGSVPIGGGTRSGTNDIRVNMNSSFPAANGWRSFQSNTGPFADPLTAELVCAGVA